MVNNPALAKRVPPQQRDKYKTVAEVASLCQRATKTVKSWISNGEIDGPSHYEEIPEGFVWLYSVEDALRFVEFASKRHPGRPKKS